MSSTQSETLSLLIVTAQPEQQREWSALARRGDYRLLEARDSAHAEALFAVEQPCLTLISTHLAPKNGYALCKHLKTTLAVKPCFFVLALHEEEPKDRRWREAGADEAVNWPRESRSLEPRLRMWARVAKAERAAENATRELEEYHLRLSYSQQDVERTTAQLVEIAAQLQAEIARNSALEAERIQAAKANTVVQAATTLQHEINNPLFAVTGSAESLLKRLRMLEDKGLPEAAELIARAERVLKGAERISQVVKAFSNVLVPTTTDYLPGVPMLQIYQEEAA